MTNTHPALFELVLERTLAAPRAAVWRCWTEPALLMKWFCPPPWRVSQAQIDLRAGGLMSTVMNGPQREVVPHVGVFLEVITGHRLVFTDAFSRAWIPSGKAFMVAQVEMQDAPGGATHYVARARHWNEGDRAAHQQMGFHEGWGIAATQLEALAASL